MNQTRVNIAYAFSIFFLTACVENASTETTEKEFLSNAETVKDSFDFSKAEPLELNQEGASEAEKEEKLLAENLEKAPVEKDDKTYLKTELNDVVVSRNRNSPFGTAENGNVAGTGKGEGHGEDNWVFGEGSGNGPGTGEGVPYFERKIISSPEIINPIDEEGIVSVRVIIDRYGSVISKKLLPDSHNTNTISKEQLDAALSYAARFKFDSHATLTKSMQVIDIRFTRN